MNRDAAFGSKALGYLSSNGANAKFITVRKRGYALDWNVSIKMLFVQLRAVMTVFWTAEK